MKLEEFAEVLREADPAPGDPEFYLEYARAILVRCQVRGFLPDHGAGPLPLEEELLLDWA